jgi:hypothetical protein
MDAHGTILHSASRVRKRFHSIGAAVRSRAGAA